MRYHIGFYVKYFLLSNALLHMGNFATGARYTYNTELPTNCPGIQDNYQELYKGHMKFNYRYAKRTGKVRITDGDQLTCDTFYNPNNQPYMTVEFDEPIRIKYVSIILKPSETYGYRVATIITNNDKIECKAFECYNKDWRLRASLKLFQCSGPPEKELSIKWTGSYSVICEVQIFTDKTCEYLPQLGNGSYVVSSAGNVTNNLYEIGTNATLQCSEGFQPSDLSSIPTKIQCEMSGQWSFTNITCHRIPYEELGMHQYLHYTIPIVIVILILIILAITWTLLYHKKTFNNIEKPQIELKTSVYIEHDEYDDPLYESVSPCDNPTQPQHVFMLKPRDSSSRPRDSLYENIDAKPDIIQHTTNSDSYQEISNLCEKSVSSEFVINDLYATVSK